MIEFIAQTGLITLIFSTGFIVGAAFAALAPPLAPPPDRKQEDD